MSNSLSKEVYLVDGARTPFLKAMGQPGPFSAADLAVDAGRALLLRQVFKTAAIDHVIVGCAIPSVDEMNIARIIALRLGCDQNTPAYTVHRNCASGMQAIDSAVQTIQTGQAELVLAGGTDAMSHAPVLYSDTMQHWLGGWLMAHTLTARLRHLLKLRLNCFKPIIGLLRGLTDPLVGLSMGQTTENIAFRFNITRQAMDAMALQSHQRVQESQIRGVFEKQTNFPAEIIPLFDAKGKTYAQDTGVRTDSTLEKLAKIKPYFDKPFGLVTAANSSQVTDGAVMLLLASKEAVAKHQLPVLARIRCCQWAGVDPAEMGLGPVHAINRLLNRVNLTVDDIEAWEINEAFAGQVLACIAAAQDELYCKNILKRSDCLGEINLKTLNQHGGAIAMGHPIGASGARIVLHLARILKEKRLKHGIASLCVGGGQGGAMLLEGDT